MALARRGFLLGLGSAIAVTIATPAIVRSGSLMRVVVGAKELFLPKQEIIAVSGNTYLTLQQITSEAVQLWVNSNEFMQSLDYQYDEAFGVAGAKIGQSLRIRLPQESWWK